MKYSIELWIGSICQQGVARQNIEDCIFIRNHTNERYANLGVSDGMGGLKRGEVACAEACAIFNTPIFDSPGQQLLGKAVEANDILFSNEIRLGATLTTVTIDKHTGNFWALSVGDSRIYHYTKGRLSQLSIDDKPLVGDVSVRTNAITRALGLKKELSNLATISGKLLSGDYLLLTTDGIHAVLEGKNIEETIQLYNKTQVLNELQKQAFLRGSQDDMAAILLGVK